MASIIKVDQIETDVNLTGSASAPSLYPMNDTNTGVFFPAADTVAISTGGTERLRVNSSGNLVVTGTTSLSNVTVSGTVSGTYTLGGTPTITAPVLSGTTTGTYTLGGTPSLAATALTGTIAAARLPVGSVLQVVYTHYTGTVSSTSASLVDVSGFSAAITPSSSSNKILVMVTIYFGFFNDAYPYVTLKRNGTTIGSGVNATGNQVNSFLSGTNQHQGANGVSLYKYGPAAKNFLDSPGTTAALTYQIAFASPYSTASEIGYINRQHNTDNGPYIQSVGSSITLLEIAA